MTNESKFPWWGWLAGLCLVPVGYVLSVFLTGLVVERLGLEFPTFFRTFYAPMLWAVEEWEWFQTAMDWITERLLLT